MMRMFQTWTDVDWKETKNDGGRIRGTSTKATVHSSIITRCYERERESQLITNNQVFLLTSRENDCVLSLTAAD